MTAWLTPFTVPAISALALAVIASRLWPDALPPPPGSGERGRRRLEALSSSALFRAVEPLIRAAAAVVAPFPLGRLRARARVVLKLAGCPLGLDVSELVAVSILAAAAGGGAGAYVSTLIDRGTGAGAMMGAVLGAALPWFKIDTIAKNRKAAVCRGLPGVIDLVALSMESGLDFVGALGQVTVRLSGENPLRFELEHLLHKLSLGWSRADALHDLAERVPVPPVRRFVASVTQAERQGTPLARVLSTQAEVMRLRRSQAAEQAAARAAIMLLGPLMLIFICVFLIILGPFVIKFIRGDII